MTKRARVSWMLVLCPLLGLGCPGKKSKGPSEMPPVPVGPTAAAPTPAAPTPITTVPPTATAATAGGNTYCIGGAMADGSRSACATKAAAHPIGWHRHGWLEGSDGQCYECWDEESDECEQKPPQAGYRYLSAEVSGCGSAPIADPSSQPPTP